MNEEIFHLGVKALIRNNKGEILLLENNSEISKSTISEHWDLPEGRLEKGDSLEKALRREVKEEIGIRKIKIGNLLDASVSKIRIVSGKNSFGLILFTYTCYIVDKSEVKLTDDEHVSFKWFKPSEAGKLLSVKFSDSLAEKVASL